MNTSFIGHSSNGEQSERLERLAGYFLTSNKLFKALRLEFIRFDLLRVEVRIPFNGEFELASGEGLSTGIITTALDSIFGLVVLANLEQLAPVATIGLNVDFTSTPRRGESVICHAEYGGSTEQVAHVRGHVVGEEHGKMFAFGSATFMIGTRGPAINPIS
ncbi:MAG: PaaI family thioesterase [Alphaproteobacteria bacterium]|nr:PaaI family thioesterase [Alphaproteobacteria bacterium]